MNTPSLVDSLRAANARLAEVLGDSVPAWTPAVREMAEHAIEGDVYRAPDGAWTRIHFDRVDWNAARTVNPAHIIMVLRRFAVLGPLASGYRATGDERYAQSARRYIEAFLRDHPPVDGWEPVPGDGATQHDIRVGVWLEALSHFAASPAFDESLMARMIQAVRGNLRYLATHVYPDRNIRFWHGQVLLLTGFRLKGLPEAAAWLDQGREIVNDAVRRQVLPDGAHMEAAPGYHGCVLDVVETLWKLARGIPELGLQVPTDRLAGMHDYMLAATRPDGLTISLHDTRYEPATSRPQSGFAAARAAFRRAAGLPEELPPPRVAFEHASQVFIRDGWTPDSAYLTVDAATRRSYHWHPCRNSITLFAHGRALLVDPGYTFQSESFPRYGHRTAHHNTVNFNGWDQSQSRVALRLSEAPGYAVVDGLYGGGYWPWSESTYSHGTGVFGEHHRTLLWIHERFGVVLDHIHHTGVAGHKPDVESCWQLSEGPAVCDPAARRVQTRHDHGNLLMAFPVVLPNTALTIHEGERDPMRGWLPVEWGRRCSAAPLVRLTAPAYDPWHGDMATVLIPFAGAQPPELAISGSGPDAATDSRLAGCVRIEAADGTGDRIIWTRRLEHAIYRQHGLQTDAALVHLRLDEAGAVRSGLMIDGTFCACEGTDVTARLARLDRLAAP